MKMFGFMVVIASLTCVGAFDDNTQRVIGRPSELEIDIALEAFRSVGGDVLSKQPKVEAKRRELLFFLPTSATDETLAVLPKISFPFKLILCESKVSDAGLSELLKFPELRSLDLSGTSIGSGEGLKVLSGLKSLHTLKLADSGITKDGISAISRFKSLATLSVAGCKLSDGDLDPLVELKSLRHLDLSRTELTGGTFRGVQQSTITGIDLSECTLSVPVLRGIAQCKTLSQLTLDRVRIPDSVAAEIGKLQGLTYLSLCNVELSKGGLRSVFELKNLTAMYLDDLVSDPNDLEVYDEHLSGIEGMKSLVQLSIGHSSITDEGLTRIAQLSKLRTLSLQHSKVTNRGIQKLAVLSELELLYLMDTDVTFAGGKELRMRLPRCRVVTSRKPNRREQPSVPNDL